MTRARGRFVWAITLVLGAVLGFCTPGLAETLLKGTGTKAFKYNGASGSISFTVTGDPLAGLPVTVKASTAADWIVINPLSASQDVPLNSKGAGKGTVKYTVAPYTSYSLTPRSGVIQIDDKQFIVTQSGVACKVTLSAASSGAYPAAGDNGLFSVTAPPGCAWDVTVDAKAPWIVIEGSSSGEAEGSVAFEVSGNQTTKPRTGKIYVTPRIAKPSKKTHTVKQLKGNGSKMQGVAAAGAPIVGTVTIKDSSSPAQEKFTTIASDGKYLIDVAGMKGPFALRADGRIGGRDYHLYSAATQADVGGTINVTPFTDLIVANIAGDIAANYFDSGNFAGLTKDEIAAAETQLQAKLQPILTAVGLDTSIDLLRTAFSADHTKLDGVLDVLQVTVDPTTKTADIVNVVTQSSVSVDVTTGGYSGDFTQADGTATAEGLTDLQKIVAGFDTFTSLFATRLPAEDNATLLGLFDAATFLEDGIGLTQFLSEPTSDPNLVGIKFTNVTVISLDPVAGTGEVSFDVVMKGTVQTDAPNRFKMIRKNGTWLMQGNQRLAKIRVDVKSIYWPGQIPASMETGLYLQVADDGNNGIDYAIATGPGLPAQGIVLVKVMERSEFSIYDGGEYPPPSDRQYQFLDLDDAAIEAIPAYGAEYTVSLWSFNGPPDQVLTNDIKLGEYKVQIRARPYKPSELSTANFPNVTAPTLASLQTFNGGTLNVAWTVPAGCYSDYVSAYFWGYEGSAQLEKQPGPAATSTSLIFSLPVKTGDGQTISVRDRNLEVSVMDDGGRSLSTHLYSYSN